MPFLKKVIRTYQLQTNIPKDILLKSLQELIDKAKKDAKWFSLANVDYRQVKLDADRFIIDREDITLNSLKGRGVITVDFERVNDSVTTVKTEIKPMVISLWIHAIILLIMCTAIISASPNSQTVLVLLILLPIVFATFRFTITIQRWRLESYLDFILSDLGIKEEMIEDD